jgi:hypothetical protein
VQTFALLDIRAVPFDSRDSRLELFGGGDKQALFRMKRFIFESESSTNRVVSGLRPHSQCRFAAQRNNLLTTAF